MQAFIDLTGSGQRRGHRLPDEQAGRLRSPCPTATRRRPCWRSSSPTTQASAKQPPSTFAGHAWDALAHRRRRPGDACPTGCSLADQRARLRDEIEATKGFVGIDGVFNFTAEDHVGLSQSDMVIVRISDGKWTYFPREQWGK